MKSKFDNRKDILSLERNLQFFHPVEDKKIRTHLLVEENSEYADLLLIAKVLCGIFSEIEILPVLHENDIDYRNKIMPGAKINKNPDFKIGENYWEAEKPTFPYNYKK